MGEAQGEALVEALGEGVVEGEGREVEEVRGDRVGRGLLEGVAETLGDALPFAGDSVPPPLALALGVEERLRRGEGVGEAQGVEEG